MIGNIASVDGFEAPIGDIAIDMESLSAVDAWILHELSVASSEVNAGFEAYVF